MQVSPSGLAIVVSLRDTRETLFPKQPHNRCHSARIDYHREEITKKVEYPAKAGTAKKLHIFGKILFGHSWDSPASSEDFPRVRWDFHIRRFYHIFLCPILRMQHVSHIVWDKVRKISGQYSLPYQYWYIISFGNFCSYYYVFCHNPNISC